MSVRTIAVLALGLFAWVLLGAAQEPTIKHVPVHPTSAASGHQMYGEYCAVCHGLEGKGDGPAASALKSAPTDLSVLSKKNGGQFPGDHVAAVLRFGSPLAAHGSADMPVWGALFHSLNRYNDAETHQRIANVTDYIKSLQQD